MVHDPDILILDEPTAGLDPIQIREVRALIRELGDRHTILLSTHIMSEVEAVCGRVIIIARGRIAVDDRLDRMRTESAIVVEARGPADVDPQESWRRPPGSAAWSSTGHEGEYATFEVQPDDGRRPARGSWPGGCVQNGWPLRRSTCRRSTLEERFVQAVAPRPRRDRRRLPRPPDDATRPHPAAPRARRVLPQPDGLPDPAGVPGHRLAELLGAGRHARPGPAGRSRACATR